MKIDFKINSERGFFVFVAFFSGVLFVISGIGFLSAFITALFIYVYLRFCHGIWRVIYKLLTHGGGGSDV